MLVRQKLKLARLPHFSINGIDLRLNAATCLGHLARIHKNLDLGLVLPKLLPLKGDAAIGPLVEDALQDIRFFLRVQRVKSRYFNSYGPSALAQCHCFSEIACFFNVSSHSITIVCRAIR